MRHCGSGNAGGGGSSNSGSGDSKYGHGGERTVQRVRIYSSGGGGGGGGDGGDDGANASSSSGGNIIMTPTQQRPRSGGCKKKKLTYDELEALNAGLKADREAEVGSCRKADARHDAKVKALNEQRKVARALSADHMLDEMQGHLQGLEFKLALAKEQIAALEEQNAELRAVNALIQNVKNSPDKITMNDGYDRIV